MKSFDPTDKKLEKLLTNFRDSTPETRLACAQAIAYHLEQEYPKASGFNPLGLIMAHNHRLNNAELTEYKRVLSGEPAAEFEKAPMVIKKPCVAAAPAS